MQTSSHFNCHTPLVSPGCIGRRVQCAALQIKGQPASVASKQQVIRFENTEFVIDDQPELKSTPEHRAIVYSSSAAIAALALNGWTHCESLPLAAIAVLAGFVFADIGSGIYHWSVDNYGSGETPVFGKQIAAFQGHHQRPWTITQREFCNNVSLTFRPGGTAAAILLCASLLGWTSGEWDVFASTSIFFICMSQQFHAWSHMKKSELHPVVVALQDSNLIISRKAHGIHHKAPFSCNYCIVNGWCNPLLDGGLMKAVEQTIYKATGIEPRCWSEPQEDWREQAPPEGL